jgi:SAM-dependent methyltransferase
MPDFSPALPDPKSRFTNRVDAYVRSRPGYPSAVAAYLASLGVLRPDMTVADVGSGTGLSSALFVSAGCKVYGIEPNEAMRAAAERTLGRGSPGAPPRAEGAPIPQGTFHSVDGSAEQTSLPDASIDLVVAAQAFHWFDRVAAKREFRRILKPGGGVALFWNTRVLTGDPFSEGYEALLLAHATDFTRVRHEDVGRGAIAEFLSPGEPHAAEFANEQRFDYAGLEGRLLSSSYVPAAGDPRHGPMLAALRALFERTAEGGTVAMRYRTEVYTARW